MWAEGGIAGPPAWRCMVGVAVCVCMYVRSVGPRAGGLVLC